MHQAALLTGTATVASEFTILAAALKNTVSCEALHAAIMDIHDAACCDVR